MLNVPYVGINDYGFTAERCMSTGFATRHQRIVKTKRKKGREKERKRKKMEVMVKKKREEEQEKEGE